MIEHNVKNFHLLESDCIVNRTLIDQVTLAYVSTIAPVGLSLKELEDESCQAMLSSQV